MRPQAHIASSLVVWGAAGAPGWEAPLCALGGNLPDFDRNVAKALGVERRDHHRWVSHSLVGWLPPTLLALRVARGSRHRGPILRATGCVWLHLLLDTYADGLAWAWPLSEQKIGLFHRSPFIRDAGWKTPARLDDELGRAEAAMWAAVALLALARLPRRG